MSSEIFIEISVLMALATIVSIVMRLLKQPLIIGHIFTGILVGPAVLNLLGNAETIEVLGKFGIALLLFIVGLGLNPRVIKELGKVSVITGVGQVLFTTALGFVLVRALGYGLVEALYISVGLAFSSTIVILKLLSDKREQNKLHGKIAIGFLLVQDIIATIALVIASASGRGGLRVSDLILLLGKGTVLLISVSLVARFVVKPLTTFLSRSQELLFLFAIAWGFGIGAIFYKVDFSLEVGALFAGISLASMPYAQDISSRLRPLRDFFVVVFFVALGAGLELSGIGSIWLQALLLSLFVLLGNPLIVLALLGLLGYTKKVSFKTSLAVAQVSEFSLIFVLLGKTNGQLPEGAVTLVTLVAVITFALSSYMIIYSDKLYKVMEPYLSLFERRKTISEYEQHTRYDIIIFGFKKGGAEFARSFTKQKAKFLIVDYDPDIIDEISRRGHDYLYGDASDSELLDESGIEHAKSVISTITDTETTELIVRSTLKLNPKALIICSSDSASHAARLYEIGATYVMMPHTIGTEKISNFINRHGLKKSEFKVFRDKHLLYLQGHFEESSDTHRRNLGKAILERISS